MFKSTAFSYKMYYGTQSLRNWTSSADFSFPLTLISVSDHVIPFLSRLRENVFSHATPLPFFAVYILISKELPTHTYVEP